MLIFLVLTGSEVQENDLSSRKTSGNSRETVQDPHEGTPAMPPWWPGQDIRPGSTGLLMVSTRFS